MYSRQPSPYPATGLTSLLPEMPDQSKLYQEWDLLSLMAFFKYLRPDWIEGLMRQFYPELRGPAYYKSPVGFESLYTFSTNKRCSVLLFQILDYNPVMVVEKMATKTASKYQFYNAVRGSLDEFKAQFDLCNKRGTWLVVENLHLLSEVQASLLIKEANDTLEKTLISPVFRIWIIYQLPQEVMQVHSGVSSTRKFPHWFGVCYYVFLDEACNISQELCLLSAPELKTYSAKLLTDITDKTGRGEIKASGIIKDQEESTPRAQEATGQLLNKNLFEGLLPTLEKPPVFIEKKVRCDIIWDIQSYQASKSHIAEFAGTRNRTQYMMKFILAILRQRRKLIQHLVHAKMFVQFNFSKDRQFDSILETLLDMTAKPGCSNPHQLLYQGLSSLYCDHLKIDDFCSSPLLLLHLCKLLIFDPPKLDMGFEFGSESYVVPGVKTFEDFGRAFSSSVLRFPMDDSSALLGLRCNEESIAKYNRSADCFKFLNFKSTAKQVLQDYSNHLEDFNIEAFAKDNNKPPAEIITRFFLNSIEYGFNLIQNHEFTSELKKDLCNLIDCLLDTFSDSLLLKIEKEILIQINDLPPAEDIKQDSQSQSSGEEFKTQTPKVPKNLSTAPKEQNHPLKNFGGMADDDFFQKAGFIPAKAKIYMILNAKEKVNRGMFRKYVVAHEFRLLASLLRYLKTDLVLAKFVLEGESLARNKKYAKDLLAAISSNVIPEPWLHRMKDLLVDTSSFRALVQSLMKKVDAIYALSINTRDLPPIINLARFLSPKSLLVNFLEFNSILNKVSIPDSVIMVAQKQADSNMIYKNSMVWTINGLKIRGGKIDSDGMLVNEEERVYVWNFGPLHLEITQFPKTTRRSIEANPHISIMLNTNFEDELDLEAEFEQAQTILLQSSDLVKPSSSKKTMPEECIEKMVYELSRKPFVVVNQLPEPSTPSMRPRLSSIHNINRSPVSTPRVASTPTAPPVDLKYVVRLPIVLSSGHGFNPLSELSFYFYCYSQLPQTHWIKRGTFLTFDES